MPVEDSRIRELIDRRQYTKDSNGMEAAQRVFAVLNAGNEAGALQLFSEYEDGKQFPGAAQFCVLDRTEVIGQNGNTVWIVSASYSTFKGFVRRQPQEEANDFKPFWSWGYKRTTVEIPFAYQIRLLANSGDVEVKKTVFTVNKINVSENRLLRILRVKYQTNNIQTLDVIADQDRKIHKIRGRYYLFLGADVQQDQSDPTTFFITYTWEYDKGTVMRATNQTKICFSGTIPITPANDPKVAYILVQRSSDGENSFIVNAESWVVRQPYSSSDVCSSDLPEQLPKGIMIELYDWSDQEGYLNLPGMVPV